jgi:hypothetical protein
MSKLDGTTTETEAAARSSRRRRWGAIVAAGTVTAGAALVAPQFLANAAEQAPLAPLTCTLFAMTAPANPVTTQGFPASFTGRLLPGTAKCDDPLGKITGATYQMPQDATGLANCAMMQVTDAVLDVNWVMADGSTQASTIRIGQLTLDPAAGPQLENAVVEGGPDAVAGKTMTVSADQQTIDAAKAAAQSQCLTGGVKNVVGNVVVSFG